MSFAEQVKYSDNLELGKIYSGAREMKRPRQFLILSGLIILILTAVACGKRQNSRTPDRPLVMGRGDWSTSYFHAALMRNLVQQLGYEVTEPAEYELGPRQAYLAMAQGDIDFWANGWYPLHTKWLLNELPDGSSIADHISPIGSLITEGVLQGYFITKSFAEKYDIKTLDDLNNDPEALEEYDKYDATPGNGIAEIYGCSDHWTCDDVIQSQIAFSGWENIRGVQVDYDAMFGEATRLINDDLPTVVHAWTPSAYILKLLPGERTLWLGVETVLDDSNPLELEGGEGLDQRPGILSLNESLCPSINEEGGCPIGWQVNDIRITARNDVIENYPMVAKLFEVVKLDLQDLQNQIVSQDSGVTPADLADQWVVDNADTVEEWLAAARTAR